MMSEAARTERRRHGWNRLFPTHNREIRLKDGNGSAHLTGDPEGRFEAAFEYRNLMLLSRIGLLAAAAFSFNTGFKIHNGPSVVWGVLEMILYTVAIGCLLSAFAIRETRTSRIQIAVALILGISIVIGVAYEITVLNPNYATDVMAFAHGGAEILLQGENPYQASPQDVDAIADRFDVSLTRTADGGVIDWLVSYPALHVLTYTAFLGIGFSDLRWATLLMELVALAVIWRVLSPKGRMLAPLVLLLEPFLTVIFTGGGVTDWLWVLPVALAAVSLHRRNFGYAGIALGLACAFKQHPWFVVPFVLIWVIQTLRSESDARLTDQAKRSIGSFLSGLVAGFVVPNLPFIIWHPESWLRGVFSPAIGNMVADGHGLAVLVSREVLDLPSEMFLAVVVTGFVLCLVIYARRFNRLQDLLWVLPTAVMFLSYRSLHSYFVFWLPIALLWLDLRLVQHSPMPSSSP